MILFYDLVKVLLLRKAPHISRFSAEMLLESFATLAKDQAEHSRKIIITKTILGGVWEKPICINKIELEKTFTFKMSI